MKDKLFDGPPPAEGSFRFDAAVAGAFDDMAARSIPLYSELQQLCGAVAARVARPGGTIYDIGCSTGASLLAMARSAPAADLIGLDASAEMLSICRRNIDAAGLADRIELRLQAAEKLEIERPAALATCNYLLQFLPLAAREALLSKIARSLAPGGLLIVSEKCLPDDSALDTALEELYHGFKMRNGYSPREIEAKKAALKDVLIPLRLGENLALLRRAGFRNVETVLKAYHFTTWVCSAESAASRAGTELR